MSFVVHPAQARGHFSQNWVQSYYSFSNELFYNPRRLRFGQLKQLNEHGLIEGAAFQPQTIQNIELVHIVLQGTLSVQTTFNSWVVRKNEVQVLTCGRGTTVSIGNYNESEALKFIQLGFQPELQNIQPRGDQTFLPYVSNSIQPFVAGQNLLAQHIWVNQQVVLYWGSFEAGQSFVFEPFTRNFGSYVWVWDGYLDVEGQLLRSRDAIGIWNKKSWEAQVLTDSYFLIIEMPM